MNGIPKDVLDIIRFYILKPEREVIAMETGFTYAYVYKVLNGERYNRSIIVLATEIALGHKRQLEENIAKLKDESIFFREAKDLNPNTDANLNPR